METRGTTEWQELATDAVVSIYNKRFDGFVRVHPNGHVEITSPAGTVTARFKELEQADWLRESYLRLLLAAGVTGQELREALAAIERVDQRLEEMDPGATLPRLLDQSQRNFQQWCIQNGIAYDQLNEVQVAELIDQAIESTRSASRAASHA